MCGIVGGVNAGFDRSSVGLLRHRGPDQANLVHAQAGNTTLSRKDVVGLCRSQEALVSHATSSVPLRWTVSLPTLSTAPAAAAAPSHSRLRRGTLSVVPVLGLALMAWYLSLFLRSVWRIGDEGALVHGAQRVSSGQIPFKDFFEVMRFA